METVVRMNVIRRGVSSALCAGMLLMCRPSAAQTVTAQGWPGVAATPAVTKPPVKDAAVAAAPPAGAKPAAKHVAVVAKLLVVSSARPAIVPLKAPVLPEVPAVAAPAVPDAPAAPVKLPELLQQQSELLARLGAELDEQRTVIAAQQQRIDTLEASRAAAASAPSAPAKATPPPALPPLTVETGGIRLKLSGLFQGWYTATSGSGVDSFRLRRTELKFSGDMSARVKWALMVDAAKALALSNSTITVGGQQLLTGSSVAQSGRVLQDAYASVVVTPALIVDMGQQKLPLSMEGPQSSGKLDMVERALFMSDKARGGGYGDIRDLGLMIRGKVAAGQLEYFGGVFNGLGESQNDLDKNELKDLAARVIVRPAPVQGLQFGGSFARDGFTTRSPTGRERHGLEFVYARGAVAVKSELMFGRDAAVTRQGGYVHVAHRLHRSLQANVRFDTWDPDTRTNATAETVTERDWLGGVTYTIANSGAWLQFNYARKTFSDVVPSRNVFVANMQSTW